MDIEREKSLEEEPTQEETTMIRITKVKVGPSGTKPIEDFSIPGSLIVIIEEIRVVHVVAEHEEEENQNTKDFIQILKSLA